MTTSANFNFNLEFCPKVSIYIYKDSYLKGAAVYLLNMVRNEDVFGNFADRFFRSNPYASIIPYTHSVCFTSNELNPPINYDYTITSKQGVLYIYAQKVEWIGSMPNLTIEYKGRLDQFINTYRGVNLEDPLEADLKVIGNRTVENMKKQFKFELSECVRFAKMGQGGNANTHLYDAKKLAQELNLSEAYMTDLYEMDCCFTIKRQYPDYKDFASRLAEIVECINERDEANIASLIEESWAVN